MFNYDHTSLSGNSSEKILDLRAVHQIQVADIGHAMLVMEGQEQLHRVTTRSKLLHGVLVETFDASVHEDLHARTLDCIGSVVVTQSDVVDRHVGGVELLL